MIIVGLLPVQDVYEVFHAATVHVLENEPYAAFLEKGTIAGEKVRALKGLHCSKLVVQLVSLFILMYIYYFYRYRKARVLVHSLSNHSSVSRAYLVLVNDIFGEYHRNLFVCGEVCHTGLIHHDVNTVRINLDMFFISI